MLLITMISIAIVDLNKLIIFNTIAVKGEYAETIAV